MLLVQSLFLILSPCWPSCKNKHLVLVPMTLLFLFHLQVALNGFACVVMLESSIYSPVVLPVREAQPENKANPKTINTVIKITFFISLLLSLDVQSDDCVVNTGNPSIVISRSPYSVPDNYFQGQRAGLT